MLRESRPSGKGRTSQCVDSVPPCVMSAPVVTMTFRIGILLLMVQAALMAACRTPNRCPSPNGRLAYGRSARPVAPFGNRAETLFGTTNGEAEQERDRQGPHEGKTKFGLAVQVGQEREGAVGRRLEAAAVGSGVPGGGGEGIC